MGFLLLDLLNYIRPIQLKEARMSQSESDDLLTRLYNELAQHIVKQCAQEFQKPEFLSQLNLEDHLAPSIAVAVQNASQSSQTQELEQQVLLTEQMIDVLEGALQDHRSELDALTAENATLKGQVERLTQKAKLLEKENTQFRLEIANNRSSMLERLNTLQEDVDRLQS